MRLNSENFRPLEFPARGVRKFLRAICKVPAALPRKNAGRCGKTAKTFQCSGGRSKAGRAPPCPQCVFCVRAHRLREAIGRHVRRVRSCRCWRLCFRRRRRRMARYYRPFKPRLPLRSEYFPKPGKRCAGTRLSRIVRRRWGSHFFRARGSPPDFPAAARRSGKCVAGVFGAGDGGVPVARFPFSDKDWSFRDGAGWGILRPIFREISAERGADWENN